MQLQIDRVNEAVHSTIGKLLSRGEDINHLKGKAGMALQVDE